jgi:heme-degrading monooxygenase HmoA
VENLYTHTTWRVKPGRQDDFVERWAEWVDWSHRQGLHEEALLLRDVEDPQRFVSFGPWESVDVVRGWRALPGYQERVERLGEVLDGFDPETLEVVERR